MEKRRNDEWFSEPIEDEEPILQEDEPTTIRIMLMKDVILNYTGQITGKLYSFNRGGSIQDVDKRDAEKMLMRSTQQSCCGGTSTPYFEIVR